MVTVNGLSKTLSDSYTYDAGLTPSVSGVTPSRGGTGGGTTITVTGSGFGYVLLLFQNEDCMHILSSFDGVSTTHSQCVELDKSICWLVMANFS